MKSSFFSHHGVWSLGVRLFRAVSLPTKAAIIASVIAVPILVLAKSYYGDKATSLEFSRTERVGAVYLSKTLPVLAAVSAHALGQAGDGSSRAAAALHAPIPQLLEDLRGVHLLHGSDLKAQAAFEALEHAKGVRESVVASLGIIEAVADGSNLTLDPDLDSYYVMDAVTVRLPQLMASALELGVTCSGEVAGSQVIDCQRTLIEQMALLKGNESALRSGLAKAIKSTPEVGQALNMAGVWTALQDLRAATEKSTSGNPDAKELQAKSGAALVAIQAANTQALSQLQVLLDKRIASIEASRNQTTLVLCASLLLSCYLFVAFRKVLDGGMQHIAAHIESIAKKDLTQELQAWGKDEPALVITALKRMQTTMREVVSGMRHAAQTIAQTSQEIAHGASELADRTDQSQNSIQASACAMEQISTTVEQTAHDVESANRTSSDCAEHARNGGKVVETLTATMLKIVESSNRIGQITSTIDSIAFKTNILALNAAVEAARAGSAGRGFAIVAGEVRSLAQSTAAAAREIKALIQESSVRASSAESVVREASKAIGEIIAGSSLVDKALDHISVSAVEQARAIAMTASAVQALESVTQQNSSLVDRTAHATSALQQEAGSLLQSVATFKLEATPA